MARYLWDLQLEDFACGWQNIYDEAAENFPMGKHIEWTATNGTLVREWIDPVQTYELMKKTFSNYKSQAQDIVQNLGEIEIGYGFTQLLNFDVALFNLLIDWHLGIATVENNIGLFRPFEYFNNKLYMNYVLYFSEGVKPEFVDHLQDLRIVDVHFSHPVLKEFLKGL